MTAPQSPAFDPRDVEESNATGYPEPFRAANLNRYNRHLGNHAGLQNYGVVMTRIVPGGQSSHRHAHSRQDEFVYVLEGEVTLETNAGEQILSAGMCAGFPAGAGDAHRFVNHAAADTVLLVVGDRTANDVKSAIPTSICTSNLLQTGPAGSLTRMVRRTNRALRDRFPVH